MRIAAAAARAGLPVKTVRYYAEIGLVAPARADNGYRDYSEADARRLGFIGRARTFGFSIAECRRLLALYEDETRASADVKAITEAHIAEIDAKMAALTTLRDELARISNACAGDRHARCPIIDHLATG
ncbi:MerR family DNA-binding protein [Pikeienuella sp. HZG-20]|uniref:MerR family DNA-binding protein n=1 Tax=Paludibacillus litoralis TaxID=3133267 RepID=UPI0030ED83E9